jgi:hypothetical protein
MGMARTNLDLDEQVCACVVVSQDHYNKLFG